MISCAVPMISATVLQYKSSRAPAELYSSEAVADFACGKPLGFHWGSIGVPPNGPGARGPKSSIFRGLRTLIHTELTEIWGVPPKLPKSPAYSLARQFPYLYLGQIGATDDVIIGPLINE